MRIVSLVPHATELLFALGLGAEVVGVTHECDFPPPARERRRVTRDVLPSGLSAAEIDAAVRERTLAGEAIYELDRDALAALAPELIVTQALCPVCAVSYEEVAEVAKTLPSAPRVIALDPKTLGETLGDVRTLAQATGRRERGVELVRDAAARIDRVELAVRARPRPRVAALEWLDPVYVAGHWTPQLIELAGGEDVLGLAGRTVADRLVGGGRGGATRGRGGDAVRLRRAARARGGRDVRARAGRRWARSGSSRSTPRRTSRGRGRG